MCSSGYCRRYMRLNANLNDCMGRICELWGGEVCFEGEFFSDVLGISRCEANGVDELGLGRLSRRLKSWFRFRRIGNYERLRGCYV